MMGIINTAQKGEILKSLTKIRSLASVPFGCRYRLIDFALSNMVNSGINYIGILLEEKYRSLLDHIGPGKAWDLDRKRGGLYFLPPAKVYHKNGIYKGDIENFYMNLDYIHRCNAEYVIICSPHIICNMNYNKVLDYHKQNQADITVVYKQKPAMIKKSYQYTVLETDQNGKIIDMKDKSYSTQYNKISLHKYLMKKELLCEIIDECASRGNWDFVRHGIINNIKKYNIYGYSYQGFLEIINSINNYYNCNLDLLNYQNLKQLFLKQKIYTKSKDEAPTRITHTSRFKNSLAANGCIIKGEVKNSILFREVKVEKGAQIKNSIIMQRAKVRENARLENVILDKNVEITQDKILKGGANRPTIIEKNEVV